MFCITGQKPLVYRLLNLSHSYLMLYIPSQSVGKPVDQLHKGHETEAKAQPPESTNLNQNNISFGVCVVMLH